MPERTSHNPGTISWSDLATTDADAAKAFYSGLFGWDYDEMPAGEGVIYSMAKHGGRAAAAISPQQPDEAAQGIPPHWNVYVTVDDVDAISAQVGGLGGQVLAGPFDVLEVGRMSVIADPAGAVLCLWQAKTSIGAEVVNEPGTLAWADTATTDPEAFARTARPCTRRRCVAVGACDGPETALSLGAVALAVLAGFGVWRRRRRTSTTAG